MSKEELKIGDKILSNGDVIEITQEMLDYYKRCKTIFGMTNYVKLNKDKTMRQDVDLRSELIEFLEANNWLNLEDRENATGIVDCYLDAFKRIDNEDNQNKDE